jgi:hypothetical protein
MRDVDLAGGRQRQAVAVGHRQRDRVQRVGQRDRAGGSIHTWSVVGFPQKLYSYPLRTSRLLKNGLGQNSAFFLFLLSEA